MTALNNRLQKEATAKPQERVSRVWISVGYNHPKGPQDQAYALHHAHKPIKRYTSFPGCAVTPQHQQSVELEQVQHLVDMCRLIPVSSAHPPVSA